LEAETRGEEVKFKRILLDRKEGSKGKNSDRVDDSFRDKWRQLRRGATMVVAREDGNDGAEEGVRRAWLWSISQKGKNEKKFCRIKGGYRKKLSNAVQRGGNLLHQAGALR